MTQSTDMGITLEEAKALKPGDILLDHRNKRWKVNGRVQTWKKPENAHRVRVPLKHGLYSYDYIDENTLHLVRKGD